MVMLKVYNEKRVRVRNERLYSSGVMGISSTVTISSGSMIDVGGASTNASLVNYNTKKVTDKCRGNHTLFWSDLDRKRNQPMRLR